MREEGKSEELSHAFEEGEKFDPRGKSLRMAKTPWERSVIATHLRVVARGRKGGLVAAEQELIRIRLGSKETPRWKRALDARMVKYYKRKDLHEQEERELDFSAEQQRRSDQYRKRAEELFGRERVKVW